MRYRNGTCAHRTQKLSGVGPVQSRCSETGCPSRKAQWGRSPGRSALRGRRQQPGLGVVGPRVGEGGITLSSPLGVCCGRRLRGPASSL